MPVRPSPKFAASIPHFGPPEKPKFVARGLLKQQHFIDACEKAGVQPTLRQARKYRACRGRWANPSPKAA